MYSKGSAVILNNYEASNYWNVAYDACGDMLTDAGFDVTTIYKFTVADFKDLSDYNSMILVNSHGNTHNGKESGRPCICTEEDAIDNRYTVPVNPSLMSYHDGYLWIGNFYDPEIDSDKDGKLDYDLCPEMNYTTEGYGCYIMGYDLRSEGNDRLLPDSGYDYAAPDVVMAAPERVQGMVYPLASDTVILSRSWTRKVSGTADLKYYSLDLEKAGDTTLTINGEAVVCYVLKGDRLNKTLRSIPMNEGIALDNEEKLLVVYKSGASYYKDDPFNPGDHPTDRIWRSRNAQ